MSGLLDLAASFNEKSKQQAERIESSVQSVFREHEQTIKTALKESERSLQSGLSDLSQSLNQGLDKTNAQLGESLLTLHERAELQTEATMRRLRKTMKWLWLLIIPALLCASLATLISIYLSQEIVFKWQEVAKAESALEKLEQQGSKIQFSSCGDRLCARIDEDAPEYKQGYRILEGY